MKITVIDVEECEIEYTDLELALHDFLSFRGVKIIFNGEDERVRISRGTEKFVETEVFDQYAAVITVKARNADAHAGFRPPIEERYDWSKDAT